MSGPKDRWDKAEIVAKLLGATLIPIVVAVTAYFLNGQISERQANTERSKLAIGILSEPPQISGEDGDDPLRKWALNSLSEEYQFSANEKQLLLTGKITLPAVVTPRLSNWDAIAFRRSSPLLIARLYGANEPWRISHDPRADACALTSSFEDRDGNWPDVEGAPNGFDVSLINYRSRRDEYRLQVRIHQPANIRLLGVTFSFTSGASDEHFMDLEEASEGVFVSDVLGGRFLQEFTFETRAALSFKLAGDGGFSVPFHLVGTREGFDRLKLCS